MSPHENARADDTRAWLVRAHADVRAAGNELEAREPVLGDVAFHSQQAVEKAMKALLAWHDVPFRKTHDLTVLGVQCAALEPDLERSLRKAAPMTEYAWRFRYPGDVFEPSEAEAREALGLARETVAAIESRLPREVVPR